MKTLVKALVQLCIVLPLGALTIALFVAGGVVLLAASGFYLISEDMDR